MKTMPLKFLYGVSRFVFSSLFAILIPCLGILAAYWSYVMKAYADLPSGKTTVVDHDTCTCSCWDGLIKGPHPKLRYLSMYLNSDREVLYIAILCYTYTSMFQLILARGFDLLFKHCRLAVFPVVSISLLRHRQ